MKDKTADKKKTVKIVVFVLVALLILAAVIAAVFFSRNRYLITGTKAGLIKTELAESGTKKDLFLEKEGRYLISLSKLDECVNVVVIRIAGGYVVRTDKSQITIYEEETTRYSVDGHDVTNDGFYIGPAMVNETVYGDTDTIFGIFGYDTSYSLSADGSVVQLTLSRGADADPYEKIDAVPETDTVPETRAPQIEESAIAAENVTADGQLPTVPRPETITATVETYPAEVQHIIDGNPAKAEIETKAYVPRDTEPVNDLIDEEFEEKWQQEKGALSQIFSEGTPSVGNIPYKERSQNMIAFNPMSGGIYVDTISVVRTDNMDHYIEAEFCSDWSDLALNTDSVETQAYYNGIPEIYRRTIRELLGETEGEALFNYIKAHADITADGGYVAYHDEHGDIQTKKVDTPVGDGVRASSLDLEEWQNRRTDDGLRYSVSRAGDGFKITIYKR